LAPHIKNIGYYYSALAQLRPVISAQPGLSRFGPDRLLLGAEAGRLEVQSRGRPDARFGVQPAGRLSWALTAPGLNFLSMTKMIIIWEKAGERGSFGK